MAGSLDPAEAVAARDNGRETPTLLLVEAAEHARPAVSRILASVQGVMEILHVSSVQDALAALGDSPRGPCCSAWRCRDSADRPLLTRCAAWRRGWRSWSSPRRPTRRLRAARSIGELTILSSPTRSTDAHFGS